MIREYRVFEYRARTIAMQVWEKWLTTTMVDLWCKLLPETETYSSFMPGSSAMNCSILRPFNWSHSCKPKISKPFKTHVLSVSPSMCEIKNKHVFRTMIYHSRLETPKEKWLQLNDLCWSYHPCVDLSKHGQLPHQRTTKTSPTSGSCTMISLLRFMPLHHLFLDSVEHFGTALTVETTGYIFYGRYSHSTWWFSITINNTNIYIYIYTVYIYIQYIYIYTVYIYIQYIYIYSIYIYILYIYLELPLLQKKVLQAYS